jgi:crotonobetainyl-CoA:carnitine CoA-transferase CaiB-like acyl-CoA transferase
VYGAIVTALYRREQTGEGANVGTSLLAAGVWAAGTFVAGALAGGRSYGLHNPTAPTNPLINPYRTSDGRWFMLVASPPHWPGLASAIGHPELLDDPRFADPRSIEEHSAVLTGLLDATFAAQPLTHWQDVLERARITTATIQSPEEVADDPQLRANDIVVPLHGDAALNETIGSPIAIRGMAKRAATRAPELGEHNDAVLGELGYRGGEIERLRATGAIPGAARKEAA